MFSTGNYAKVWTLEEPKKGNYIDAQISTSRKDDDGEYYTDFSGFVRLIGDAKKKAKKLEEGDVIIITSCGVTNKYDKKKKTTYVNYLVFDFDTPEDEDDEDDKKAKSGKKSKKSKKTKDEDEEDE